MGNLREDYLSTFCDEVTPMEFYRAVFPEGELQRSDESGNWKCNAIAVELLPKSVKRYTIGDDLGKIEELLTHENFILISPIGYVGKSREAKNARFMYALAIDLDGVDSERKMADLFYQMDGNGPSNWLPKPSYIVSSGNGLHIYYVFKEPIPCFKNIMEQLAKLKQRLTKKLWNGYVTCYEDNVQYQSVFQGFRMVGGVTKDGNRVRAFEVGEKVTVEYLNEFVEDEKDKVTVFTYKSGLTKAEAKKKYPEWYERRIEKGAPRGTWTCKEDLYEWWKRRIKNELVEGHRYYGVMCLAVYAQKCGIPRYRLETDAFGMLGLLDEKTEHDDNHFTRADVLSALEMYNDSYITFPIETISQLTDLRIERNKRNGRKQEAHLYLARRKKEDMRFLGETINEGRPKGSSKEKNVVAKWQSEHPNGKKADCIRETGLTKPTVYRWWQK